MSRWFRFYADAIRDPKVATLSDGNFRLWIELLSVASTNDGLIPPLEALKSLLKRRSDHLKAGVDALVKAVLLDPVEGGFEPHNWRKFQYKSDTSSERVKRFRNNKRNVSETPPDTETDTENTLSNDNGHSPENSDADFWKLAKSYVGGKNPGALIGKWCKDFGKEVTAQAITRAQLERPVEKVSFIVGTLQHLAKADEGPTVPL